MTSLLPAAEGDAETLARLRELRPRALRELKAVGGNPRTVRRAPTGRESGPGLWAVLVELPRDEALGKVDAAL